MREIIGPRGRIPPGPGEKYDTRQNLLEWMGEQFRLFGDIYKASVYGTSVYVISDPDYVQHVLRENWQNYVKGQAIKRVALLLGNGLMVSEGAFWKTQRRMIQPAFQRKAVAGLVGVITATNTALLRSWEQAAEKGESVNVTLDISRAVLEAVLKSIFGDDYAQVASGFNILSQEPMRNLEFAQTFASLSKVILEIASKRRAEKRASPDILGMLMEARDRTSGQPMSDRQLVN